MPSWNNVVTTNAYQQFRFRRARRVTLTVSNSPIFAQFAPVIGSGALQDDAYDYDYVDRDMANGTVWGWTPDDFPGSLGLVAVRIRSQIPNTPALVTIHA